MKITCDMISQQKDLEKSWKMTWKSEEKLARKVRANIKVQEKYLIIL